MTKKSKMGRPPLKVKKHPHPYCWVDRKTAMLLNRWRLDLKAVEPTITRGRMLDRLVELAELRMDESVRLTLQANEKLKPLNAP